MHRIERTARRRLRPSRVSLALALIGALGCGGGGSADAGSDGGSEDSGDPVPTATMAECPTGSTLTYDGFASQFFTDYCLSCHDSALSGADRAGAPPGVDFEDALRVSMHAATIDAQAGAFGDVVNEFMPPVGPYPSLAEREDLAEWIACGQP